MNVQRQSLLLGAALSQSGPSEALERWNQWSAMRPRFEDLTPAETHCLSQAWRAAGSPHDTDEGRIRGMERQASVSTSVALGAAGTTQECLYGRGIPSALTGGAAISLLIPTSPRSRLGAPQLLIEPSCTRAALKRDPALRERVSGSASLSDVHIVWRSALREIWASDDLQRVLWHRRELIVPAPHRVAFDSVVQALFAPGDSNARIVAAILDVAAASEHSGFDRSAWDHMVERNRLGRMLGVATAPFAGVMRAPLTEMLRTSHTGNRWDRFELRSLRALGVRTLPR